MLLEESAWRDRQVEGQGPDHRWTRVPLDRENKILTPGNRAPNPGNKMLNLEDQMLAAYKTRDGARIQVTWSRQSVAIAATEMKPAPSRHWTPNPPCLTKEKKRSLKSVTKSEASVRLQSQQSRIGTGPSLQSSPIPSNSTMHMTMMRG